VQLREALLHTIAYLKNSGFAEPPIEEKVASPLMFAK
jgi:hypothetical protein